MSNRMNVRGALALTAALGGTAPAAGEEGEMAFRGYDPVWKSDTVIRKGSAGYTMDGAEMEVRKDPRIRHRGIPLAMVDRIGKPNMYYVLDIEGGKLAIYVNCEFGTCTHKRTIKRR